MTTIRSYSLPADTSPDMDDALWVDKSGGTTRSITLTTLRKTLNVGVYNVLDYGAVGNGTTDDTTAIQAAIDAAVANKGGVVNLPTGTYKITSALNLLTGVTLQGAGLGDGEILNGVVVADHVATTLKFSATSGNAIVIDGPGNSVALTGIMLRDLRITGNIATGGATTGTGLWINGNATDSVNGVRLDNVTIRDFKTYGLHVEGASFQILATGCHFLANAAAQYKVNDTVAGTCLPSENVFFGCTFDSEETTNSGPANAVGVLSDLIGGDSPKLYACTIQQCGIGINIIDGGTPILHGCHIELNDTGVHQAGTAEAGLYHCYFVLNGIDVLVDTTANSYTSCDNCTFSGSTNFIQIDAYSGVRVRGNKILGNVKFDDNSGVGYLNLDDTWRVPLRAMAFTATPDFDIQKAKTFAMTLTGNVTSSTISNAQFGAQVRIMLFQNVTGGHTFAWPADVKLAGGAITLSGSSKCDSVEFIYDGADWYEIARAQNC